MLMAGRIFIVAGYLVLPVVGAILSRRRGHEGIGGGA
jgi:hypothetical protein